VSELQQVMQGATQRLLLRFAVTLDGRDPIFQPVAWKHSTADKWQRFTQSPTVPQAEVYSVVTALGGQMEREALGIGSEMVYWFERK
jgi:hypothetical protein